MRSDNYQYLLNTLYFVINLAFINVIIKLIIKEQ